jgi:hypothetical protein
VLVSAFMPVEFYDYRPAAIRLGNLACKKADLLALPFEDSSVALEVGMIEDATEDLTDRQEWSCGCFWFTK